MIYYVEDDDNIRELVIYTLHQTGLAAEGFGEAESFNRAMKRQMPELVLLDIMLPGEDGISILKRLRASSETAELPIIMVTAKGEEYDRVIGLDGGADDYITKPFGMAEMVARVRALLRRAVPKTRSEILLSGDLAVDLSRHTVAVNGAPVVLTLKEYSLLVELMESKGRVFTREQLLESVWGYGYEGGTRTVDVHVQTLRTKLGKAGEHIETVRGVGYRYGE